MLSKRLCARLYNEIPQSYTEYFQDITYVHFFSTKLNINLSTIKIFSIIVIYCFDLLISYKLNKINAKSFIAAKTTNVMKLQIDLQKNDLPRQMYVGH